MVLGLQLLVDAEADNHQADANHEQGANDDVGDVVDSQKGFLSLNVFLKHLLAQLLRHPERVLGLDAPVERVVEVVGAYARLQAFLVAAHRLQCLGFVGQDVMDIVVVDGVLAATCPHAFHLVHFAQGLVVMLGQHEVGHNKCGALGRVGGARHDELVVEGAALGVVARLLVADGVDGVKGGVGQVVHAADALRQGVQLLQRALIFGLHLEEFLVLFHLQVGVGLQRIAGGQRVIEVPFGRLLHFALEDDDALVEAVDGMAHIAYLAVTLAHRGEHLAHELAVVVFVAGSDGAVGHVEALGVVATVVILQRGQVQQAHQLLRAVVDVRVVERGLGVKSGFLVVEHRVVIHHAPEDVDVDGRHQLMFFGVLQHLQRLLRLCDADFLNVFVRIAFVGIRLCGSLRCVLARASGHDR